MDLSSYTSLQTNLFVRLDIPSYSVLRFSDYHKDYDINSETYDGVGSLLALTSTKKEIMSTNQEVTVAISGIPSANLTAATQANIKGSSVKIYRGIFNKNTGDLLSISGNPELKFSGIINSVTYAEDYDVQNKSSSFSIIFICTSSLSVLKRTKSGRRTNPIDQERLYTGDTSMKRVPEIKNSNFNFGAPASIVRVGTK
jgi:hypothetical protein